MFTPTMTMLDDTFMSQEAGFVLEGLKPAEKKIQYKKYYFNTCNAISKLYYLKPTRAQIEEYIENGTYIHTDTLGIEELVECRVSDLEERIYLFKMAQAKQLEYDWASGRAAMLRGENVSNNLCPDAIDCIKQLGLYRRTLYCV